MDSKLIAQIKGFCVTPTQHAREFLPTSLWVVGAIISLAWVEMHEHADRHTKLEPVFDHAIDLVGGGVVVSHAYC